MQLRELHLSGKQQLQFVGLVKLSKIEVGMNRNIYALLVGIDEYVSPVTPLKGCVNDITAVKEYLEGRLLTDGYQLHLRTLFNQEATRQAIIDGFRQHLCQASSEDIDRRKRPLESFIFSLAEARPTLICTHSPSRSYGLDFTERKTHFPSRLPR